MNQDTAEETLPSRSWKWRHPLLFCGMAWLFSAQSAGIGIFAYIHLVRPFASGRIPGVSPMPPIVIGLAVGLLDVLWAKHLLQNRIEEEAQILAFPKRERSFRQKISQVLPYLQFPTITCAVGLILYFIMTSVIRPYVFVAPIVAGALFAPMPLQYPELLRRYRRAKEIATQSPEDADTYRSRAVEDIPAWPTVFSVFTIIAFLALGIWLQWGLPAAAQAEPDPYLTTTEPVGEAVQLTYNSDASSPAISPDGKLIAYVRDDMHNNYLETMSIDGRKKRRISTQVSAKYFAPLQWSPDGSRILVPGQRAQSYADLFNRREKTVAERRLLEKTESNQLWVVDVATGEARKITQADDFIAGAWIAASHRIVALEDKGKTVRLLVMDEDGRNVQEVSDLSVSKSAPSFHPWHGGREFVVVGAEESPGIWSVDTTSGEVTHLSDLLAEWGLPLDEDRLVIGMPGDAYPPFKHATSVGILDLATGEVEWVIQHLQGGMSYPTLLSEPPILFFVLRSSHSLWGLALQNGSLRKLTSTRLWTGPTLVWTVPTIDPKGESLFYAAMSKEEELRWHDLPGRSIWRLTPDRSWEAW